MVHDALHRVVHDAAAVRQEHDRATADATRHLAIKIHVRRIAAHKRVHDDRIIGRGMLRRHFRATQPDRPLEFQAPPGQDPVQEARERGRPFLVFRMGQRDFSPEEVAQQTVPGTIFLPGDKFLPAPQFPPCLQFPAAS